MPEDRIDLGEDIGYAVVALAGVEARLDLYAVSQRLRDLLEVSGEGRYLPAVLAYMTEELHFPEGLSLAAADRFACAIFERYRQVVEMVKKNASGAAPAGSPASTTRESLP